ncbi:MAG: peptidoglycan DD-metalloendopeptidase family protein [Acidimicrobiales bacterium]
MHRFLTAMLLFTSPGALAPPSVAPATIVGQPPPRPAVHIAPVDAPILDPFRLPDGPYGRGNRGIEYDTEPGDVIAASADGVVVFAGSVAGSVHVTVRHSAALRTTAAFVGESLVAAGESVAAGQPIARAAGPFHFTARVGDRYIDPKLLYGEIEYRVRLIAVE